MPKLLKELTKHTLKKLYIDRHELQTMTKAKYTPAGNSALELFGHFS